MPYSIKQIAQLIGAELRLKNTTNSSSEPAQVVGYHNLNEAKHNQIAFIYNKKYLNQLSNTQAGYVLLKPELVDYCPTHCLVMSEPRLGMAKLSQLFSRFQAVNGHFISQQCSIDSSVQLPQRIYIGAHVSIAGGVSLAEGCFIGANCVIEQGVTIGQGCYLSPNVTIHESCRIGQHCFIGSGSVIGSEGFGYEWQEQAECWQRIHHQGRVIMGDFVDIGSNASIDRGTIADTYIEDGVKIDNLVMISHNCHIGSNSLLAAQTGMAGNTHLGKRVITAGQVGFAGHMQIADGVRFNGKAMVVSSVSEPNQTYSGYPAQPDSRWKKQVACLRRLEKGSE